MSFSSDSTGRSRPLHEKVVYAVANADGVDPIDLDPLYETIDPEALDALFEGTTEGTIKFTYEGHDVVVRGDEATVDGTRIDVRPVQTFGFGDDAGAGATGL